MSATPDADKLNYIAIKKKVYNRLTLHSFFSGPDYVALTTSAYRQAVDNTVASSDFKGSEARFVKPDSSDPLNLPSVNGTDESVRGLAATAVSVPMQLNNTVVMALLIPCIDPRPRLISASNILSRSR